MIKTHAITAAALLCATMLALSAAPAWAQISAEQIERVENEMRNTEQQFVLRANPELSVGERAIVDYGAVVNFSFLAIDDSAQNTRILRQTDARLYGRLSIDGVHEFFGRLRFLYQDFNEGDSFRGDGDRFQNPIGDRYWYKFNYRRAVEAYQGAYTDWNFTAQVGLQYITWGSGLTYSDELYAGVFTVEHKDWLEWEGMVGMTPNNLVIDVDSSRPDFDENTQRYFIGNKLTLLASDDHKPYVYYLIQREDNDTGFAAITLGPVYGTYFDYDSEYLGIGSTGSLLPQVRYAVEAVYQTGEALSNSFRRTAGGGISAPLVQTVEDISAWAVQAEVTYLLFDPQKTRFEVETVFASGDADRAFDTSNTFGGNTTGTDDNAFNAFGYVNTGLAFAAPTSNLAMVRMGASTFPFAGDSLLDRLQVGIDLFLFNKLNSEAPIDEATNGRQFLGFEADVYANWRAASDLGIFFRYGVFAPGSAITADKDERHYFYTGITYTF